MPIYEYQCADCHHKFDVLQKITDASPEHCPQCAMGKVVRLVSAAGFQLKGTGWYATDFKNKGKPETTSDSSAPSTTDSKDSKSPATTITEPAKSASVAKKGDSD